MKKTRVGQRLLFLIVIGYGLLIMSAESYAAPVQLFVDTLSEAICRLPLEVDVFVVNANGEVDTDFKGKKELHVTVQERGGIKEESFYIHSKKVRFKKGRASFFIEDDEEESLDLEVAMAEPKLSGSISLSFQDKDIFPPEIVEISADEPGIIKLEFNEELEEESGQETKNYKAVTNRREVYPESIEYHRTYVYLKFEEHFQDDEVGYIELDGIKDLNENEVSSGVRSDEFEGICPCMD